MGKGGDFDFAIYNADTEEGALCRSSVSSLAAVSSRFAEAGSRGLTTTC